MTTEGSERDTRLNYTRKWVNVQAREGLVIINDVTFLFFAQLEERVWKFLPREDTELGGTHISKTVMPTL